jgi:acetolactate synthase-1/2/3 large subunit
VTDRLDGGEAILAACRSLGVDVIFSSPGSEWAPVWEALARQDRDNLEGPRYVDLMHETLAVAMATGYTQVTGRPQLVLLHAGPGLLQGACGIHGALLSGVAMVICSAESITYGDGGQDPGSQWYRNLSVVGGPHTIAEPFVKWANQAASVGTLYGMVVRAAELAQRAPAGPVYLNVPVETLLDTWSPPAAVGPVAAPGQTVSLDSEVAEAARRLVASKRPVLITESAGRTRAGWDALAELANLLAIPVVEPQSAVCANFPRTDPLHQGGMAEKLAAESDLVVLVACRAPFYPPSARPQGTHVLVIDEVPHRPYMGYQVLGADQYLEGDLAPTLQAVSGAVKALGADDAAVAARHAELSTAHDRAAAKRRIDEELSGDTLTAAHVVGVLRDLIDPSATVVDETITHARTVQAHLGADRYGRYTYVQGGLGQGIGVALGTKLADPHREVALVIGDGSFLYNPIVQSLAASSSLGLPVLIVVFNNHQYLSMKLNHLRYYPEGAAVGTEQFRGVDLSSQPALDTLMAPLGLTGIAVRTSAELRPALERALADVRSGTTALVNVHLDR